MPSDESLNVGSGEDFLFTLAILLHLERITFRADFFCMFETWDGQSMHRLYHPIPAIKHAIDTISSQSLRFLKLDFNFNIDRRLPPAKVIWSPLVHLVAESPFPCVKLHVGYEMSGYRDITPGIIPDSLADSAELMKYVNRGVLVITPGLPVTNKQDVLAVEKISTDPPI